MYAIHYRYLFIEIQLYRNCISLIEKFAREKGSTDQSCEVRSVRKTEGSGFHGMARAIQLMNSLSYCTNENIPKSIREFSENYFPQHLSEWSTSPGFIGS